MSGPFTTQSFIPMKTPMLIEIFPTMRCNLQCRYCDRADEEVELSDFHDVGVLYRNLLSDPDFQFLKFRVSGREPTLYSRCNELVEYLCRLSGGLRVDFLTNGLRLEVITPQTMARIILAISVYQRTKEQLEKNALFQNLKAQASKTVIIVDVPYHEDIEQYGTKQKLDFNPFTYCVGPVLLGGTKKVFPCCRAHRFEKMYGGMYHYQIDTPELWQKLKALVIETELCSRCPYVYSDRIVARAE